MLVTGRWLQTMGVAAALTVATAVAGAQTWTTTLSGANTSPPNSSPGTGQAQVSLSGTMLSVNIIFSNLMSPTTASHIHCCTTSPFTGSAAVATIVPTFPGFPLGVTSGSYQGVFDLALASSYNPAFLALYNGDVSAAMAALVAGMNSGTAYVNVHTTAFPSGEITGFLTVPEPGSMLLVATGLVGVMTGARRRRAIPE